MQVSGNLRLLERNLQVATGIKGYLKARAPLSLEEIHHPLCPTQVVQGETSKGHGMLGTQVEIGVCDHCVSEGSFQTSRGSAARLGRAACGLTMGGLGGKCFPTFPIVLTHYTT